MGSTATFDTRLTRLELQATHARVRAAFPDLHDVRAAASVTRTADRQWCVQIRMRGAADFFWYGRAYNATEARSKGWRSYLGKHAPAPTLA